jgi:hypothetical protein
MNDKEWLDIFHAYAMEKRDAVWRYDDEGVNWDYWSDNSNKVAIEDSAITFDSGNGEMLKVTKDGFYVRGVKVEQGPGEAEAVYAAFKEFMTWAILSKPQEEE